MQKNGVLIQCFALEMRDEQMIVRMGREISCPCKVHLLRPAQRGKSRSKGACGKLRNASPIRIPRERKNSPRDFRGTVPGEIRTMSSPPPLLLLVQGLRPYTWLVTVLFSNSSKSSSLMVSITTSSGLAIKISPLQKAIAVRTNRMTHVMQIKQTIIRCQT